MRTYTTCNQKYKIGLIGMVGPLPLYCGFLVSGVATSTLLASYLNWVAGFANPDRRPICVGLSNMVAAVISLIAPFNSGAIAQQMGYEPLFLAALVMVLGALFITLRYIHNPRRGHPSAASGSRGTVMIPSARGSTLDSH